MKTFPIPAVPSERQKPVERLVERILAAKQRAGGADVSALENELDEVVYALYALTPAEIAIVESASVKTPARLRAQANDVAERRESCRGARKEDRGLPAQPRASR